MVKPSIVVLRVCLVSEALEARRLVELRDCWLNPPEWVEWVDEPVPGYPKRPIPPRRGGGEGAQEAHADEPLQCPAAVARGCPRGARRCPGGGLRLACRYLR